MNEGRRPADFTHRILLAVTGLTPQVVTETLYALAVQGTASGRFVPTEVHVITTLAGSRRVCDALLSPESGAFHKLCSDYGLKGIRFDESCIHVVEDAEGQPLDDINSAAENTAAADCITRIVHELVTGRPDTAVHASIAGGRKTMGFFMGYAMSLLANPQDRLSHVLVNAPFESLPDFFYIPPKPKSFFDQRGGHNLNTRDAVITLAEIPFVRMRAGLPERVQQGQVRYSDVVIDAQEALRQPQMTIDMEGRRVLCGDVVIEGIQGPEQIALLRVYAERRMDASVPADQAGYSQHEDFPGDQYLAYIESVFKVGIAKVKGTRQRAGRKGGLRDKIREAKSRINAALVEQLGPERAQPYLISEVGTSRTAVRATGKPYVLYGLTLRPSAIRIIAAADE